MNKGHVAHDGQMTTNTATSFVGNGCQREAGDSLSTTLSRIPQTLCASLREDLQTSHPIVLYKESLLWFGKFESRSQEMGQSVGRFTNGKVQNTPPRRNHGVLRPQSYLRKRSSLQNRTMSCKYNPVKQHSPIGFTRAAMHL